MHFYLKEYRAGEEIPRLALNYQNAMVLKPQEEAELANYIVTCSKMFYGLFSEATRRLTYEMAVGNDLKFLAS
ncbi:pogo transposable element with znf domain [Plakobranchus ocellatus]|uniref:Pogo transposable element with znf domain n=1 Tax=Plakobranchus ocellatus TaxID=259542 RepID=A0AAV3YTP8_9GAST|nr:pogo transposable element with znf domain [Plakobranchus ocellatus]